MITVYGASGDMGRRVCQALASSRADFAIAGRDRARLDEQATRFNASAVRRAEVHDAEALAETFSECDVVVNCAGEYPRIGETILAAAVSAGCHYVDLARDQAFIRNMYERYSSAARKGKVTVVNACGAEGALGDWGASAAASAIDARPLDTLTISRTEAKDATSPLSRHFSLDALAQPGWIWEEDRWTDAPAARRVKETEFPLPFGRRQGFSVALAEVITVPRHVESRRIETFACPLSDSPLARAATVVAPVVAPLLAPLLRSPLGAVTRAAVADTLSPEHAEKAAAHSHFAVVAEAKRGFQRARASILGSDARTLSAHIVVLMAQHLASGGAAPGVLAPAQVMDARDALGRLADEDLISMELP